MMEQAFNKEMREQCKKYDFTLKDLNVISDALLNREIELEKYIKNKSSFSEKYVIELKKIKKTGLKIEMHIK